ncbi:hypothetical protein [Methylobacterium persicinum]|uniref:Uncharacterized protein n=1 Tax=Methylobacterium persicinum TaxID=374426 RepID=A0ABU0HS85_9HYPH|nr:hypothetical protein [Methylobacterium persicinum]MDQ0445188.1 hypothetical protein [Methylobacterium persicinum]
MFGNLKQNILLLIFVALTVNLLALSGAIMLWLFPKQQAQSVYNIIDCGDNSGKIHKCIRIDAKAGEINDAVRGASYRVIYGQ